MKNNRSTGAMTRIGHKGAGTVAPKVGAALLALFAFIGTTGAELPSRLGSLPTPPSKAGFSVDSLIESGGRGGRMYPVGTNFTALANREMGEAMEVWNARRWRDGNEMFKRFYERNPDSPWAGEAELHVAAFDRLNGNFEASEEHFLSVLTKHGDKSDGIKQRVLLHLPQLYWETGRPRAALASLKLMAATEMDWPRRQFYENWTRLFGNAIQMEDKDRKCGTIALALALEASAQGNPEQPLLNISRENLVAKYPWAAIESKHPDGYSLADLAEICGGEPRQIDYVTLRQVARPGSPVLVCLEPPPASRFYERMNRKQAAAERQPSGHFVVVENATDRLVTILDPRYGEIRQEVNRFCFTWKGKVLLLPGQDKGIGQDLSAAVAAASRGGCCGSPTPADSMDNTHSTLDNGQNKQRVCTGVKGPGDAEYGIPNGAPSYRFGLSSANMIVSDVPLWLPAARGPDMAIRLDHNRTDSRNGAEYTNVNYYCFGNKWTFNYASIYREAPSENVTVFLPEGRHEEYYKTNSGLYVAKSVRNKNRLAIVGGEAKLTVDADDSVYYFSTNTESLLRIEDRYGNAATFQHDPVTGWLTNIADSAGRSLVFQYSDQGLATNVVDSLGRNSAFAYSNGNLVAMTDMGGYQTRLAYNTNNWIVSAVYPQGLTNTFDYSDGSQLGSPYNEYPEEGYPAFRMRAANSLNYTNECFYQAFVPQGPVVVKDATGNAWAYEHDAVAPYSFIYGDAVDALTDAAAYIVHGHQWVRRVYDDTGVNLAAVHYPASAIDVGMGFVDDTDIGMLDNDFSRYFTYEANGWLAREEWKTNGVTCAVWSNRYDSVGNLLECRDPLSNKTTFAYNAKRDMIAATNALGAVVRFGYNPDGTVSAVTNARGYVTRLRYDTHGFNTNVVFADLTTNVMTYDSVGRLVSFKDAAGDLSSVAYDKLDRVTNVSFASDSTRMAYHYAFTGVTNIVDRLGRTTAIGRDPLGRVSSVTDARGDRVGFTFDPMDNVTAINIGIGGAGKALAFEYSSMNGYTRLARTVSALGRTNIYAYTFRGLLASHTDPRGVVVNNDYDLLNRVVRTSYGVGTNVDFAYNALSWPIRMSDALTTNAFAYDAIGQVTSRTSTITVPGFSNVSFRVDYKFDAAGNLTNRVLTGTGGLTNIIADRFTFDSMDRLTLVSNQYARAVYAYDSAGRLASKTYGNGDVTTCGYGPESRLASLTTSNAGVRVQGWSYAYNAMGGITNIASGTTNWAFQYDAVDRLTAETYASTNVTTWTYDSLGNRTMASNAAGRVWTSYNDDNEMTRYSQNTNDWIAVRGTVTPGPGSNKWYNSWAYFGEMTRPVNPTNGAFEFASVPLTQGSNRLSVTVRDVSGNVATQTVSVTKVGAVGASVTHDVAGNLTGVIAGSLTNVYEWDAANRLTRATSNGVEVLRCWYDGVGRRIAKTEVVGGITNRVLYVYDGMTIMAVLNQQGKLLEYYTRGLGVGGDVGTLVAATHTAASWTNGTFYVHSNHRGDVTAVRSGTATVATYDYTAFGEMRSATGSYVSRFRFSSKELDRSTGFYYFGFRHLSPAFGRFVSADPLGLAAGINVYTYAGNDVLNMIDPYGLCEDTMRELSWWDFNVRIPARAEMRYMNTLISDPTFMIGLMMLTDGMAGMVRLGTEASASVTTVARLTVGNAERLKLQRELSRLRNVENELRRQLDNGRNLAEKLRRAGTEPNPYGLGREITETLPNAIRETVESINNISKTLRR